MAGPISFGYQVLGFGAGKAASTSGGPSTTKVRVRFFNYNEDCSACVLGGTYEVWEDDPELSGGDLGPSVNDIISGYAADSSTKCAKVVAINSTASADGQTVSDY